MNALRNALAALAASALVLGCGAGQTETPPPDETPTTLEVGGELSADTTWAKGTTVILKENTFVMSGTLTIEPGVTVKGNPGAALVVTQNAKLRAIGTAAEPITFTANKDPGTRARGDWSGLVLLGKAPINVGSQSIEGFPATETRVTYGGQDAAHDCGTLKYVRIQFAGFEIAPGKEVNSLTLGGCGTGTTIDYVQNHRGSDDGIEVFGGTVNLKHVVNSLNDDDGLDWDLGWTGKVQYLVIQEGVTAGNHGFEASSNATNASATPQANPTIWNVTLAGPGADAAQTHVGIQFKDATAANIHRAIIADYFDSAIDVTGTASPNADGSKLVVADSVFFNNANAGTTAVWGTDDDAKDEPVVDELAYFSQASFANRFADPQLGNSRSETAPDFRPASGGAAFTSVTGTVPADGFFESNGFVGAVGATDWTAGWTAYPAN